MSYRSYRAWIAAGQLGVCKASISRILALRAPRSSASTAPAAARDQVQAQLVDAWLRGVSAADEKQTYPSPPEYRRFISMRRCHYARLHPDRRYTGVVAADCGKAIS